MTAHQTFDEWFYGKGYAKDESGFAREIWNAAMENAARICEEQRIGIDAFGSIDYHVDIMQSKCAEAIREAAKR